MPFYARNKQKPNPQKTNFKEEKEPYRSPHVRHSDRVKNSVCWSHWANFECTDPAASSD